MKRKMMGLGLVLAMGLATSAYAIDPCKDEMGHDGQEKTDRGSNGSSATGNIGSTGYHYEIWYQGGNNSMTYYANGTYKASWNGTNDFLARIGFKYDEKHTYEELGPIDAYFKWSKQGSAGGYNYIGIYGWTVDPLVEYYIVDDWFNKPGGNLLGSRKGEFEVDGAKYEIWQNTRVQQPSIKGTSTFPQYFSVRDNSRSCGHIDITAHFKKWESMGMQMGKMYEAKVLVEAGGGSGSFDVSYFKMTDAKHPLEGESGGNSSSSEAVKSSSSAAKSSSSRGGWGRSSSSGGNSWGRSSSSVVAMSSATWGLSSSTDAIAGQVKLNRMGGTFQVFDMQGKLLGKVELAEGASLKEAIAAKFNASGVYTVKQGSLIKTISVEAR